MERDRGERERSNRGDRGLRVLYPVVYPLASNIRKEGNPNSLYRGQRVCS